MSKLLIPSRRGFLKAAVAAPAILRATRLDAQLLGLKAGALFSGFSDAQFPSLLNRPVVSGNVLSWVGPLGGGADNGNPVAQTRTLTPSGDLTISSGQTVSGLNISGRVTVADGAVNPRLMQCNINTSDVGLFVGLGASGFICEDCCITGTGTADVNTAGIQEAGATVPTGGIYRRNNVSGYRNAMVITGNTNINQNFCWGLADAASDAPHYQTIEMDGGQNGTTIRHNSLQNLNVAAQTTVIQLNDALGGTFQNVTVDGNLIMTNTYAFEVTNQFNNSPNCSWICTNNQVIMGSQATCSLGSISGTTLTVAGNLYPGPFPAPAFPAGGFQVGMTLYSPTMASFTTISSQLTGTPGGAGTYRVNNSQTVSAQPIIGFFNNNWFYGTSPVIASPFTGNVDFYSGIAIPGP